MNAFATGYRGSCTRLSLAACLVATISLALGCQTQNAMTEHPANPALRRIEAPAGTTAADADRAALARFVGVWNFEGWSADQGSKRNSASGRAAGTIENEHFLLLDLQATSGQLSGRTGRKSGSMLFASEPGIGLTVTAWGDASPSITRLVGYIEGNASAYCFHEAKTPPGMHQHALTITFQTDDKWVAEVQDMTANDKPVVARYEFTRAAP
jgi:hypothetical protein